jgi:hypothetical protein
MEPNVFLGYLERGIVVWPNEGIVFLLDFGTAMQYELSKDMIRNPNYFRGTYNGVLHIC